MKFNIIDIENWTRKEYFEHYMNSVRCTYSMTTNIDITDLLYESKQKNLKLYPILLYIITTIVNRHTEFRTCHDGKGNLGYWESMSPSYTIFHKENETFSNIWTEYNESFISFHRAYLYDCKTYGEVLKFSSKPMEPANTFPVSSIPWVSFTEFNLNIYNDGSYLIPIFTIGKFFEQNNKTLLPISIQAHHAVCDGFHISRFINEMQELAFNFNTWIAQ